MIDSSAASWLPRALLVIAVLASSTPGRARVQGDPLVLENWNIKIEVGFATAGSIRLGPTLVVSGPSGRLRLTAGDQIILENGVQMESGGELVLAVEPLGKPVRETRPKEKRPGSPRAVRKGAPSREG